MIIKYKTIEHERYEDAPFIGALISSIDCHINCKNCFNQHLKELPTIEKSSQEIIDIIKANPFNQGIILAGLEWTEQPNEMRELINVALLNNLQVMLYTGLSEESFNNQFNDIYNMPNIYIKFGSYQENLKSNNKMHNVKLATSNQIIYKMEDFK